MGTLTPNLQLTVPTIGGDVGPIFAQEINGDLNIIDSMYGGVNSLSVAGNTNVTASEPQAQNLVQSLTGALTGNVTYFLPAVGAFYAIENATTGAFNLSVGCTAGANTLIIPQGLSTWVWTDGSVIRVSNPPGWQEIATYFASNTATLAFALPGPFRRWRVTAQSLTVTATTYIGLRGSINGGSSFVSASSYAFAASAVTTAGTESSVGAVDTSIHLTPTLLANSFWDTTFEIANQSTAQFYIHGDAFGANSGGNLSHYAFGGNGSVGGLINAAQLLTATGGPFSGTIILEGLP